MKILIVVSVVAMLAACSSKKEQPATAVPQAAVSQKVQDNVPSPQMHGSSDSSDLIKKEVCESGQDKRFLEVHKKVPGCELSYSKFGKTNIISSSKHGMKHCDSSLEKITKKLEAQKFDCKAG